MNTEFRGHVIFLNNIEETTTPEDIQEFIANRTGMKIDLRRIRLREFHGKPAASIWLSNRHLADIFNWAFQDDRLYGHQVQWRGIPDEC